MAKPGRPRQFDLDDALRAAMRAFWARGFEATSVCDLVEATGVQKGSLYKAFGDKRSLFLAALERYLLDGEARLAAEAEGSDSATAAIHAALGATVDAASCRERLGCFGVNALAELAPSDAEVARLMKQHRERVLAILVPLIERGQAAGELAAGVAADEVASVLYAAMLGLQVQARGGLSPVDRAREAAGVLRVLAGSS